MLSQQSPFRGLVWKTAKDVLFFSFGDTNDFNFECVRQIGAMRLLISTNPESEQSKKNKEHGCGWRGCQWEQHICRGLACHLWGGGSVYRASSYAMYGVNKWTPFRRKGGEWTKWDPFQEWLHLRDIWNTFGYLGPSYHHGAGPIQACCFVISFNHRSGIIWQIMLSTSSKAAGLLQERCFRVLTGSLLFLFNVACLGSFNTLCGWFVGWKALWFLWRMTF